MRYPATGLQVHEDNKERKTRLSDYRPSDWLIERVDLDIRIFDDAAPARVQVQSVLHVCRNPEIAHRSGQICLTGYRLQLEHLSVDDRSIDWQSAEASATIRPALNGLDQELVLELPIDSDRFKIVTLSSFEPEQNTDLMGLYQSSGLFCTQCEAEGFRRITWYLDRPDILARFRTRIEADRQRLPVLLSNGNPVSRGELDQGRHYVLWDDPHPKPCYLFALVAGQLDAMNRVFQTASGREVELKLYAPADKLDRVAFSLEVLIEAMRWDEQQYGREYDLDVFQIVAVDAFNFGAMENKGLNIFNTQALYAQPHLATDAGYRAIRSIVAHEYFHNWSGNRVTLRDWFQLSLKEGFTVFRDQQFSADFEGEEAERIRQVQVLKQRQFAEDASPLAHPVRASEYQQINNFYTVTVYEKGAELVRMLRELLGVDLFRAGSDLYFAQYDGQAVRVEDLLAAMSQVSGRNLDSFMLWYQQAGTPRLKASGVWNEDRREYRLRLEQCYASPFEHHNPVPIPVVTALLDSRGSPIQTAVGANSSSQMQTEFLLELDTSSREWLFAPVEEPVTPSLLRRLSAPVILEAQESQPLDAQTSLLRLARDTTDSTVCWQTSQQIYTDSIAQVAANPQASLEAVQDLWGGFLQQRMALDMKVLLLSLPSVQTAFLEPPADPEQFVLCRHRLYMHLTHQNQQQMHDLWESHQPQEHYRPDPSAMGRRALANFLLHKLTVCNQLSPSDHLGWLNRCRKQVLSSDNLTDRLAALQALLDSPTQAAQDCADELLAALEQQWHLEPLLMDQWFAVQARPERADMLSTVQKLCEHSAFLSSNPNRVRALLGTFANNAVALHRPDGAGYHFLADWVIKLDGSNPMVASRLLTAFGNCQKLLPSLQAQAHIALQKIRAQKQLSTDVGEQLARLLAVYETG